MSITLRTATSSDLDAILSIALRAMPLDPQWPYRFPHAEEHREDHERYTRMRYVSYLESVAEGACALMLAESPSIEDPNTRLPIAMGIWQLPGSHTDTSDSSFAKTSMKSPPVYPDRQDADPAHVAAFRDQIRISKQAWFDNKFGERQLNLLSLATHPDYQQRGAGEALVKWGMNKAKEEKLTVTLFASPMGRKLYTKLGFNVVGMVHVQVEGEEEALDFPGMVWSPEEAAKTGWFTSCTMS